MTAGCDGASQGPGDRSCCPKGNPWRPERARRQGQRPDERAHPSRGDPDRRGHRRPEGRRPREAGRAPGGGGHPETALWVEEEVRGVEDRKEKLGFAVTGSCASATRGDPETSAFKLLVTICPLATAQLRARCPASPLSCNRCWHPARSRRQLCTLAPGDVPSDTCAEEALPPLSPKDAPEPEPLQLPHR